MTITNDIVEAFAVVVGSLPNDLTTAAVDPVLTLAPPPHFSFPFDWEPGEPDLTGMKSSASIDDSDPFSGIDDSRLLELMESKGPEGEDPISPSFEDIFSDDDAFVGVDLESVTEKLVDVA